MGAQIKVEGRIVTIEGGAPLSAAPVMATDLRGGIAVMIAALMCSEYQRRRFGCDQNPRR